MVRSDAVIAYVFDVNVIDVEESEILGLTLEIEVERELEPIEMDPFIRIVWAYDRPADLARFEVLSVHVRDGVDRALGEPRGG